MATKIMLNSLTTEFIFLFEVLLQKWSLMDYIRHLSHSKEVLSYTLQHRSQVDVLNSQL